MKFDVLTLFPDMFGAVLGESIIGRAQKDNLIEINAVNIRDFSKDKHRRVDDYPYGGGTGMVMQPQPIYDAFLSIVEKLEYKPPVIYMSPQGRVFNQEIAMEISKQNHVILLCGHYEGIDERVIEEIVTCELSIGDYVLTGGELAAMVVIDAVSRLVPGVLAGEEAYSQDSHYNGLLEYPQYTRPPEFNEKTVPDILLSGHHANINKWRHLQSLLRTRSKRLDLFNKYKLSREEKKLLEDYPTEE